MPADTQFIRNLSPVNPPIERWAQVPEHNAQSSFASQKGQQDYPPIERWAQGRAHL